MNVRTLKDSAGAVFSPKVSTDSVYLSGSKTTLTTKLSNIDNSISGKADSFTVSSSENTADWGKSVTVGTVAGTDLKFVMPANPDTDTHYTAKNVVASSSTGTENVSAATSNPYLNLVENGTVRSTHRISGSGSTTVTTDTSGNIIISSTGTGSEYDVATQTSNGLMSSTDKTKLDGIATGANKTIVDSSLSSTSTNPVQNKAVYSALSGKADSSHSHNAADITGLQSYVDGRIEVAMSDINAILDSINGEVV